MARGSRKQEQQEDPWVPTAAMPTAPGHPPTRGVPLEASAEHREAVAEDPEAAKALADRRIAEGVADQGYHRNETTRDLREQEIRTYIREPDRGRRDWEGKAAEQTAGYANRRRIRGERGKALLRKRGELLERPFAHGYETGGMRRTPLRYHANILKRLLVPVAGFHLGLVMRQVFGIGKPRRVQEGLVAAILACLAWVLAAGRSLGGRVGRTCPFAGVALGRTAYCRAG